MCLALYLAAPRPLSIVSGPLLRVEEMRGRGWPGDLFGGEHQYRLMGGCACVLLDDTDSETAAGREAVLAELEAYLETATEQGPVHALVCWGGDERKAADTHSQSVSVAGFRAFDFGKACDQPTRLTITSE